MSKKRYQDMTTEELRQATKEFDKEWTGPGLPGQPLSAGERAWWKRAQPQLRKAVDARRKAAMGRPKMGEGVKVIALSIEQGLLRKADELARRKKISRAALVAEGLETLLKRKVRRSA